MRNSEVLPADPAQRRANRLANLGDELKLVAADVVQKRNAHEFSHEDFLVALRRKLVLEREIARLN